jgi:hypothetical protein
MANAAPWFGTRERPPRQPRGAAGVVDVELVGSAGAGDTSRLFVELQDVRPCAHTYNLSHCLLVQDARLMLSFGPGVRPLLPIHSVIDAENSCSVGRSRRYSCLRGRQRARDCPRMGATLVSSMQDYGTLLA